MLSQDGKLDDARRQFEIAVGVDGRADGAAVGLAAVYEDLGDRAAAAAAYRRLLDAEPSHPDGIAGLLGVAEGDMLEAALRNMRTYGRIVLCGMIANYNDAESQPGPRGLASMIGKRLTMRGFIVTDHPDTCKEYVAKATRWLSEGRLKYHETIVQGIENAPAAFVDMLKGNKVGKQIVQLAEEG